MYVPCAYGNMASTRLSTEQMLTEKSFGTVFTNKFFSLNKNEESTMNR